MVLKKECIATISLFIFVAVFLNPDLKNNQVLYYAGIVACLLSLIWCLFGRIKLNKYMVWRIIFIGWAVFSYLVFAMPKGSPSSTLKDLILHTIPLLLTSLLVFEGNISKILKVFIYNSIFLGVYIFAKVGVGNLFAGTLGRFILGEAWNSNSIGQYFSYSFLFLLAFSLSKDEIIIKRKDLRVFAYILFFLIILWTGSRKALLVVAAGSSIFYLISTDNKLVALRRIIGVALFLTLLYLAIMEVPQLYDIIGVRFERLFLYIETGEINENSLMWRTTMIENGINYFKQSPFLGMGLDCFRIEFGKHFFTASYAHNNFIEMLVDGGIVGFIAYYSCYFWSIKTYIKNKEYTLSGKYLLAIILICLVMDYAMVSYLDFKSQFILCVLATTAISPSLINGGQKVTI